MSDLLSQDVAANQTIDLDGWLFWKLVKVSKAPVTLEFMRHEPGAGGNFKANNAPSGYRVGPLPEHRRIERVRLTSTVAQTITYLAGDERADVDGSDVELSAAARSGANFMHCVRAALTVINTQVYVIYSLPAGGIARGVLVKSHSGNAGDIEIVTTDTSPAAGAGFRLEPGESQYIPIGSQYGVGEPGINLIPLAAGLVADLAFFADKAS